MKHTLKALTLMASLTVFNAVAQPAAQPAAQLAPAAVTADAAPTLTAPQETLVRGAAKKILTCAMANAPKDSVAIQAELYPTSDTSAQLVVLATNANGKLTPVTTCDDKTVADQVFSLAPYLKSEDKQQNVGYLFFATVDEKTIRLRFISLDEQQKAVAAAQKTAPAK